jgi:glycosyltransferase involved in cell wall biosynthesis
MRILYVSPFPPIRDGIGTYTQLILGALRDRGHQARAIVPREESLENPDALALLSPRSKDLVELCNVATAWNPDCIHVQFAVAAFGTRTLALIRWLRLMRSRGVPIVLTMHEVTRDIGLLGSAGGKLYRSLTSLCDHVIVHTQGAFSECVRNIPVSPEIVSVIPHPKAIPPPEVVSGTELRDRFVVGDSDFLLAFGFVHVDKGLSDLVRALCLLQDSDFPSQDSVKSVKLVIAGAVRRRNSIFRLFEFRDRVYLWHILRMARRGGVDRNILLTGYVPEAEIAGWFRAASAVVLPYRRTEQSGVAALANAFGTPALASTVGGLRELYGDSAWTFPPANPQELARVLEAFLALPSNERVSTGRPQQSTELNAVITSTIEVYRSIVSGSPAMPPADA